jgi:hypothetical protein
MKSPPVQHTDDQARDMVEAFIAEQAPEVKASEVSEASTD